MNIQHYAGEMLPPPRFTARDFLRIMFRRKWIMLICCLTVVSSVIVATNRMKEMYRAEATMMAEPGKTASSRTISRLVDKEPSAQLLTISELMRSRAVLARLVTRLGLEQDIMQKSPELTKKMAIDRAISLLRGGRININAGASNIIHVVAVWDDGVRAANLANTLCDVFIDYMFEDDIKDAQLSYNYIKQELEKATQRLQSCEQNLENFKIENNLASVGTAMSTLQSDLKQFRDARRGLEVKMAALNEEVEVVKRKLAEMKQVDPELGEHSEEVELIRRNIFNLEMERDGLLKRYTPQHPSVQKIEEQIAAQRQKMVEVRENYRAEKSIGQADERQGLFRQLREADVQRAVLDRRMSEIDADIERVKTELNSLPVKELEFRRLTRVFQSAETIHHALETSLESAQRTLELTRQEAATIKIIDEAILPRGAFYPNVQKNYLLGVVGGIAFALTVAFLLEFLNHTLESSEDVHQHIGLPVLGTVPVLTLK